MVEEFHQIDVNKGGYILFGEFIEWALLKNLDIEDDVDWEVHSNILFDIALRELDLSCPGIESSCLYTYLRELFNKHFISSQSSLWRTSINYGYKVDHTFCNVYTISFAISISCFQVRFKKYLWLRNILWSLDWPQADMREPSSTSIWLWFWYWMVIGIF